MSRILYFKADNGKSPIKIKQQSMAMTPTNHWYHSSQLHASNKNENKLLFFFTSAQR
jgi:hypothetical protein